MAGNDEWVEDVRRWCVTGSANAANRMPLGASDESIDGGDIGYEAAQPSLQNMHPFDAVAGIAGGEHL
jgi:hypothetical protein